MPLYICNARCGALDAPAKQAIAKAITHIHCEVTGAPAAFVHAVFLEDAPQVPLGDLSIAVRGTIRKGRSDDQKDAIAESIRQALVEHGGVAAKHAGAEIRETPASWVLEGGEIMPEPGEEAAWFAAQEARRQAAES